MKKHLYTDVLIVGGGLVGSTLACALAKSGLRSIVIDKSRVGDQDNQKFDGRATAISQTTKKMLDVINIWSGLGGLTAPILDIRVADGKSPFFLHFDHSDLSSDPLGYMVENRYLRRAIFQEASRQEAVVYLTPVKIINIVRNVEGVIASLADGRIINASLIVGSDGRGSYVREDAGIGVTQWSYKQTGIVCTVSHEKSHINIAHEHFYSAGPFAILPLTGKKSSIVWTEKQEDAEMLMELSHREFLDELSIRFGEFLGSLRLIGPRSAFPLHLHFTKSSTSQRLALVGDSIHGLHPVAGQGLNMGLRDVAALTEVLAHASRLGLDIGTLNILKKYERWRRFDNTLMLAATDGLNRLFSNEIPAIQTLRGLGLGAVNASSLLKKIFMRQAMGLTGNLPRLLKGENL